MTRRILVTGAGSGIGRAVACRLAREGAELLLLGRREEPLREVLESLPGGSGHQLVVADILDAPALRTGLGEALSGRPLTGLVANAGIGGPNLYGEGDRWSRILETNLTGTYQTVQEALPHLRAGGGAGPRHVVLNASLLARMGAPLHTAYCASKAGILGLMRAWAVELAPEGILVNAVCPGWVDTPLARQGLEDLGMILGEDPASLGERLMAEVPLGKPCSVEEVAELVAYLVSPGQRSMTGSALDLNNGAVMNP